MRLGTIAGLAMAGDFDGSGPLLRATRCAMQCTEEAGCEPVSLEGGNVPTFLDVDFKAGVIRGPGRPRRTSKIVDMTQLDGKLFLQGAEDGMDGVGDGRARSIAIRADTGGMVLTASGDNVGFVVSGACVRP